jgi:hypothetical protein
MVFATEGPKSSRFSDGLLETFHIYCYATATANLDNRHDAARGDIYGHCLDYVPSDQITADISDTIFDNQLYESVPGTGQVYQKEVECEG